MNHKIREISDFSLSGRLKCYNHSTLQTAKDRYEKGRTQNVKTNSHPILKRDYYGKYKL